MDEYKEGEYIIYRIDVHNACLQKLMAGRKEIKEEDGE